MIVYGKMPQFLGQFDIDLSEVMYYLYLPVVMHARYWDVRLPGNVKCCLPLIERAMATTKRSFEYVYLSARKGWATPDNPLNRPGWHCDGFGTDDVNAVYWVGAGTRFASQAFTDISTDHVKSMQQFEEQVKLEKVVTFPEKGLYLLDPSIVHATPVIKHPGGMRQYIKVSLSNEKYNLENNSHNYLFDYQWPLHHRDVIRNDPARAQLDYIKQEAI